MNNKREHYLSMHTLKIFQDKDGRWKTTIPDETKNNGRRLIAKTNLKDLQDIVIAYYEDIEKNGGRKRFDEDITLEELYPIWLDSRVLEVNSLCTVKRNSQDWNRYYKETSITKIPMRNLTVNQLKDWAHTLIDIEQLDKRQYYNMSVIMKKCFEFASDEGLCENTWSKVKINTKKLKRIEKKSNETQIYFNDEKNLILRHSIKRFLEQPWCIGILTIPFLFVTGMRIGEIVALKYEDLDEFEIHIRREEVNDFEYNHEQASFKWTGKTIVDHVKTDAGIRSIPYTKSAKQIIELVKRSSQYYGYRDNDFIFCPNSKRLTSNSIDHLLYSYCDDIGIPRKSAHKIRKTYISKLAVSGIDMDTVCRIAGHVDLKTTFQSYYYSLERKEDIYEKFDNIFESVV